MVLALLMWAAQEARDRDPVERRTSDIEGTLRLQVDNDFVAGTDEHYTSGWTLAWDTPAAGRWEDLLTPGAADVVRRIPFLDGDLRRLTVSFSQILVTPADIENPERIKDDAPYAGALLLSVSLSSQDDGRLDVWQLTAGLVGPSALGKETQEAMHGWIDTKTPRGWDHQLEDEFLINLHYLHKRRFLTSGDREGWSLDAGSTLQMAAGTLLTHASAGLEIRGGWRMPSGFEKDPDGLRMQYHGYGRERVDVPFGIHMFASAAARAWANTIFLDGNTFRDSHAVDKKTWMLVGGAGLSVQVRRWRVTLELAAVSDPVADGSGYDTFGGLDVIHTF